MLQIGFNDNHGGNSAAIWIDDGGSMLYNKEDNLAEDFNEDYGGVLVGDGLCWATLWESGKEAKDLIKEYFDINIKDIINVDGIDFIKDVHFGKINDYQQVEWTNITDEDEFYN